MNPEQDISKWQLLTHASEAGASISVTVSIALNSMSEHALCTAGFSGISCIAFWLLCLPRKFSFVAKIGIPSTISILVSVLIVMISLGVTGPANAEVSNPDLDIVLVGNPCTLLRSSFFPFQVLPGRSRPSRGSRAWCTLPRRSE